MQRAENGRVKPVWQEVFQNFAVNQNKSGGAVLWWGCLSCQGLWCCHGMLNRPPAGQCLENLSILEIVEMTRILGEASEMPLAIWAAPCSPSQGRQAFAAFEEGEEEEEEEEVYLVLEGMPAPVAPATQARLTVADSARGHPALAQPCHHSQGRFWGWSLLRPHRPAAFTPGGVAPAPGGWLAPAPSSCWKLLRVPGDFRWDRRRDGAACTGSNAGVVHAVETLLRRWHAVTGVSRVGGRPGTASQPSLGLGGPLPLKGLVLGESWEGEQPPTGHPPLPPPGAASGEAGTGPRGILPALGMEPPGLSWVPFLAPTVPAGLSCHRQRCQGRQGGRAGP